MKHEWEHTNNINHDSNRWRNIERHLVAKWDSITVGWVKAGKSYMTGNTPHHKRIMAKSFRTILDIKNSWQVFGLDEDHWKHNTYELLMIAKLKLLRTSRREFRRRSHCHCHYHRSLSFSISLIGQSKGAMKIYCLTSSCLFGLTLSKPRM